MSLLVEYWYHFQFRGPNKAIKVGLRFKESDISNTSPQLAHEDGTEPDTSVAGVIMAQQEYDRSVVILLK